MYRLGEILQSIGFKKNEVDVYVDLLKLKKATALEISKKTGIYRSNVYDALDKLIRLGFVIETNEPKRMFESKDPSIIQEFLNQKKEETKEAIKNLDIKKEIEENTKVGIVKGKTALRQELFKLLTNEEEEILISGFPENIPEIMGPLLDEFNKERKLKKINQRVIYNSTAKELAKEEEKDKFTRARNIPKKYDEKVITITSEDTVLLVILEPEISIIIIKDKDISNFYKKQFSLLWKTSAN